MRSRNLNKELRKRSKEVVRVLAVLSKKAKEESGELILLGGSAVQALLKEPKRLSVDLDLYYSGEPKNLVEALRRAGYDVVRRKSPSPLFDLYKCMKEGALVKVDFVKVKVPPEYVAEHTMGSLRVKIPIPEYLMAAKLASLAIGATGRMNRTEEIGILKDLFDFNILADEFDFKPEKVNAAFEEITRQQNELRGTRFTTKEAYAAAGKTLREVAVIGKEARITQGMLNNFGEYLVGGCGAWGKGEWEEFAWCEQHLSRSLLSTIALRALAYAKRIEEGKGVGHIDKGVDDEVGNAEFVNACVDKLEAAGENVEELHKLKAIAPRALLYLYYSRFPEAQH